MPVLGGLIRQGAGALLRNLTKVNSTPQEDWDRAVSQGTVGRYFPGGPPPGVVVAGAPASVPGAGYAQPQVPWQSQQAYRPPAQQLATVQGLPIAYNPMVTPTMGAVPPMLRALPQLGAAGGWTTGGSLVAKAARSALPVLNTALAIASGYQLLRGLWYDATGAVVGRARRRRRVNPLNYRAAMRAVRRLHQLNQFNTRLEALLPTKRVSRKTWPKRRKRKS